ncbi:HET-domain-containing protein, partial [Clathrospora elynae]
HEQCQKDTDLVIPVKRVLDLAGAATDVVRIIETTDREGQYVALSHCWGHPKTHPLMTTHATLKDRMSGIALSSLPRSFRDAIIVCRRLDVQYIWIDCLCIVQDDGAEWLAEAEKMADIYSKSYLTVATSRAQNSQDGFLFDFPDDTVHYRIKVEAPWANDLSEHRTLPATFKINHKSDSKPLDKRAWCLQEWYLPKRLVEFGLNNIRLLCLRSVETRFGRTNDEHTWMRTIARAFGVEKEDFFRTLWENIRGDLFRRSITSRETRTSFQQWLVSPKC